ncbi:MAG: hypothetical protein HYV09_21690 [Deltaproteobacteria bacterium]|nr:hypothetical protein [Deltaproteobacteria bacterium]
MTLQEKVDDLRTITGCLGGFVTRDGATVASGLPAVFDHERLDRVAAIVRKLGAMADKSGYADSDFVMRFGKATLVVQSLGGGAHLALACEPAANVATIEVFASVAADDIRDALAHHVVTPPPPPVAPVQPSPPLHPGPPVQPSPPVLSGTERLEHARRRAIAAFGDRLATAKSLLIGEVGPIGDLLFVSALDRWLLDGPPDWARAHALRDALASEIDAPASKARFSGHAIWGHTQSR